MLLFEAVRRQAYQITLIIDTTIQGPPLAPGLASIASRSFFLSGQLFLGNLSETVVVVGNTPHYCPGFLVSHVIGNRASANAQDPRNELSASHQLVGEMFQAIKPPQPPAAWPLQSSIV